jgi:putative sterol carrier protein
MATVEECRAALEALAARMSGNASQGDLNRTLACRVTDLDVAFHGRLADGRIVDLADGDDPSAKLKLTASSDDLIALVDGKLNIMSAWTSGRIKIDASIMDLMRLRKML